MAVSPKTRGDLSRLRAEMTYEATLRPTREALEALGWSFTPRPLGAPERVPHRATRGDQRVFYADLDRLVDYCRRSRLPPEKPDSKQRLTLEERWNKRFAISNPNGKATA